MSAVTFILRKRCLVSAIYSLSLLLIIICTLTSMHALNKIIHTQSLLRVIDRATQSSGQGIKGKCPGWKCFAMRTNMAAKC